MRLPLAFSTGILGSHANMLIPYRLGRRGVQYVFSRLKLLFKPSPKEQPLTAIGAGQDMGAQRPSHDNTAAFRDGVRFDDTTAAIEAEKNQERFSVEVLFFWVRRVLRYAQPSYWFQFVPVPVSLSHLTQSTVNMVKSK